MDDALERPALYYPYIHIRSEHWLKATLLCVSVVKRIVPESYTPEDNPSIIKYTRIVGPKGPLLQAVPPYSPAANCAQQCLLERLRQHDTEIRRKFQRSVAPKPDNYWIHDAKFNDALLDYLVDRGLAWQSSHDRAFGHRTWYALHPTLGSAIMTTLGLSIAREQQFDIVTPSAEFHEALLSTKEDAVFGTLLSADEPRPVPTSSQASHDLGQLVIALTGINYQTLQPEDIPELQASKHFRRFQHLIQTTARSIDRDDDPRGYRQQLRTEAREIIDAWNEAKSGLSRDLKEMLFESALILSGEGLRALIKGPAVSALAVSGGVAIGLLISKGQHLRERHDRASPYQYLTEVTQAQNEILRMTFPLGLEP